MKFILFLAIFISSAVISLGVFSKVIIDVPLLPSGQFSIDTGPVVGKVHQDCQKISSDELTVLTRAFKSGLALRDLEIRKYFGGIKEISLTGIFSEIKSKQNIHAAQALLKIGSKVHKINFKYKLRKISKNQSEVFAKIPVKVSDFGFSAVEYLGAKTKDHVIIRATLPVLIRSCLVSRTSTKNSQSTSGAKKHKSPASPRHQSPRTQSEKR